MDKLISSLLCCSVDSRDDANDKSTERSPTSKRTNGAYKTDTANRNGASRNRPSKSNDQTNRDKDQGTELEPTSEQTQNAHSVATKADTSFPNHPTKKDLLDEDNSINETDTITNTNDESNNTPTESKHPLCKESAVNEHDDAPLDTDEDDYDEDLDEESYLDLTKLQEGQAFNPETGFLLGHKDKKFGNKKCLILDLDETLVHSSFKYLRTADFVIPVEIDNQVHHVYVIKRPGVDEFLRKVGKWYEVVVFTASVAKYGDPLLDKLDVSRSVHHRLFRDSCYNYQGNFIKNLSQIGRPLADSIIIDNSPASYIFHPQHSIPISSWFSDTHDNELLDLLPFLEDISKPNVDDVELVLDITL